jgi:hypothetical protein
VLVAESYGGRDEPVDTLVNNLVAVNVVPVFDALRVKATPTEGTYQARPRLHAPPAKEASRRGFEDCVKQQRWKRKASMLAR